MRVDSDWNHYEYRYGEDDHVARIAFDVGCALMPTPATHAHTARIRLAGSVAGFEERLAEVLADVDCWLVGVLHYADVTTLVVQVEDVRAFRDREDAIAAAAPVDTEILWSDGWDFFTDRVCPTDVDWRRILDREQLEGLDADIDLETPYDVGHAFFGSEAQLRRLLLKLVPEGFEVREQSDRHVVVSFAHRPADVSAYSVALMRFAASLGALYDGWTVLDIQPG